MPLFILTLLLAADPTVAAANVPDRLAPFQETFAALAEKDRGAWISEQVLTRIDRASAIALSSENLKLQRRFLKVVDARLRAGKKLSGDGFMTLVRKMDSLEQTAIRKATAKYHRSVAELFAVERDKQLRVAALQRVEQDWQASGQPIASQHQLLDWIEMATQRLHADRLAKLPAIPKFDESPTLLTRHIGSRHTTRRPTIAQSPGRTISRMPLDSAFAGVNVDELRLQVAGYHLALAAMTAKLASTERPSIELIESSIGELEELAQRYGTLKLYLGLLDPDEAPLITPPKELGPTIGMVANRIFKARQQLEERMDQQSAKQRVALNELSKRLAGLSHGEQDES